MPCTSSTELAFLRRRLSRAMLVVVLWTACSFAKGAELCPLPPVLDERECRQSITPRTLNTPLETSLLFNPVPVSRPLFGPPLLNFPEPCQAPPGHCPPPAAPGYMRGPTRYGIASPVPPAVTSAHAPPWDQLPTPAELGGGVMRARPHHTDCQSCPAPYNSIDFTPDPFYDCYGWDACEELGVYGNKHLNRVQRPLLEWGVPFYSNGPLPRSETWLGCTNLVQPKFYVYGDFRTAVAYNDNGANEQTVWAGRLNLDIDLWITATERFHMFWGPLDENNQFLSLVYDEGDVEYVDHWDGWDEGTDTAFFEGDLGYLVGGWRGIEAPFDMPFAVGLIPLFFQNGIWIEDAFVGAAVTIPARNKPGLDWSNFDTTLFIGFDEVTNNQVFDNDTNAGNIVGATTFIERRGGYIEVGYAFVDDNDNLGRGFHSVGASYTRRYLNSVSNSLRTLVSTGQDGPRSERSADGVLLLMENSFLTRHPYNVIPYANLFAGFGTPRTAARLQGPLKNTGINFESDLLTGYPFLDDTGNNTYGGALGLDLLGHCFEQQLIVELAFLQTRGPDDQRVAQGDQYALGARYQKPLSNTLIFRADAMYGLLEGADDISGGRIELRRKF